MTFDELGHGGDKNGSWDIPSVATTFAALGTDQINTKLEALLHVLRVTDHWKSELRQSDRRELTYCSYTKFRACEASRLPTQRVSVMSDMCVVYSNLLWWHAHGADEQLGTAVDDNINQNG